MGPRLRVYLLLAFAAGMAGCARQDQALTQASRGEVVSAVRSFMQSVARDVTTEGPTAWQKEFADDPAFFMAADGSLAFPDRQAATTGIQALPNIIKKIELHWGDDLRVDVLTPDLAMVAASYHELQTDPQGHQKADNGFFTALVEFTPAGRWQFRNAHWSSAPPAAEQPH
jgi:hypothetical protein